FVSWLISQFKANAALIASSIPFSLGVGNTPGYPQSIAFVFEFGSAPNPDGEGENIFEFVFSSTCTSKPMTVSKFIQLFLLQVLEIVYGNPLLVQKHNRFGIKLLRQNNFRLFAYQ